MSERLSVLLEGKSICAFELLDAAGQYIEELRHQVRIASQAGELLCPDCGQRMILCAGAVVLPYFRHFKQRERRATMELKTKSGRRKYFCRKALFQIAKNAGLANVRVNEEEESKLVPILFDSGAGTIGYVYLDGKTRNFGELWDSYQFYLDINNNRVLFRKKYRDGNGKNAYFEETVSFDEVIPDEEGKITRGFLEHFRILEKEEKQNLKKVKRILAEEGVSEEYQDMAYVLMDSVEEIWILPRFRYRMEKDDEADERRLSFLEEQNLVMYEMPMSERRDYAWQVADYVSRRLNSWDWI